jgi:hypothetical protein
MLCLSDPTVGPGQNIFTADGAVMVWNDKVYMYVDRDDASVGASGYVISDWLLYETSDMVHWTSQGSVAGCKSFAWCNGGSTGGAAAPQVVERDDVNGNPKFYLYGPVNDGSPIGVLVADKPEGPFKDARGIPLIYSADTANMGATHSWRNLDPTAFVDDNGQAYLAWGNNIFFWTKLEDDMIHLKGESYTTDASGKMQNRSLGTAKINAQTPTGAWSAYEEAPWLSKHGDLYYLTYAANFPETINYATSTSAWTAQQIIQAFPEDTAPRYIIRDRDGIHGDCFCHRVEGMAVERVLTAPQSPWQNPHTERLLGSARRECLDHVIVLGERHLRKILRSHIAYYRKSRTHLSLGKDAREPRLGLPSLCGAAVSGKKAFRPTT